MIEKYGADAIRLYLINSPLVRGESLKFKENGLIDIIKEIFLPLYNSLRFLLQNILRYENYAQKQFLFNFEVMKTSNKNIFDQWIVAYNQRLIKNVRNEMENYKLYKVVPELLIFIEKLTNWYIRLNRQRLKGNHGSEEAFASLNILFGVLLNLNLLLSPFIPFLTEFIYQNLKNGFEPGFNIN